MLDVVSVDSNTCQVRLGWLDSRLKEYCHGDFKEKYPNQLQKFLHRTVDRGDRTWITEEIVMCRYQMPSWQLSPTEAEHHQQFMSRLLEEAADL